MPSLGADMEDGTFVEWHVEPGQHVARGQVICVVETQKGAVDVEIWQAGTLAKLIAAPRTEDSGGAGDGPGRDRRRGLEDNCRPLLRLTPPPPGGEPRAAAPRGCPASPSGRRRRRRSRARCPRRPGRVKISPAARRRAEELGVDLAAVKPSGAHGVIAIADVELAAAAASPRRRLRRPSRLIGRRQCAMRSLPPCRARSGKFRTITLQPASMWSAR